VELSDDEISFLKEAVDDRLALLQRLPPSEWRDLRLAALESVAHKLNPSSPQNAEQSEEDESAFQTQRYLVMQGGLSCPFCQNQVKVGDNFCLSCGNRLTPAAHLSQRIPPAVQEDIELPAKFIICANKGGQRRGSLLHCPFCEASIQPGDNFCLKCGNRLKFGNLPIIQEYCLPEKGVIHIGRAPGSDICLTNSRIISRHHATVSRRDDQYVLCDENSSNGTLINGERLEPRALYPLYDSDQVRIGDYYLIFRSSRPAQMQRADFFDDDHEEAL
jgi:hypothetical protein